MRDHIAKDDPAAARRGVTRLREVVRMLAGAPAMGRARPEFGTHLGSSAAGAYVLFDRPLAGAGGIEFARVLHGALDPDVLFSADME
ncbi:MAG TPA: type II toxin-antitoxin system RelE/ParE family toxin [Geminicoccaceae bacterium]|nr:type II toxin-antitoxin system RelE/ParE family toxin [Geminicoccaceae bacterium]